MTHRLVMANLSNWDGEDFEINVVRDPEGKAEREKYIVRPGEHCDICWGGDAAVEVIDRTRENPPTRPFRISVDDSEFGTPHAIEQTFPKMSIEWESKRGKTPPVISDG